MSNEPTGLPFLTWISVAKQKDPPGRGVLAGGETLLIALSDAANPDSAPTIAASDEIFCGTIQGTEPYPLRGSNRRETYLMNILPVDRALSIYGALADRSETKGARKRLSEHLMKKYIEGEKDEHRLTVEGLSYLHNLDREIDSRN